MFLRSALITAALLLVSCVPAPQDQTPTGVTTGAPAVATPQDILILGDSQISFGAGAAYTAYFGDLAAACALPINTTAKAIGVRSTALHHWTARTGPARGTICDVDATYGVNAGAYGVTSPGRSYVQIGTDPAYPYCPANRSPLEAATAHVSPDLVVVSLLGNATDRWQSRATAQADWRDASAQLPPNTPCLVMTTIPTFEAAENARRQTAQANLAAAVTSTGDCAFVPGITAQTIAAIQGNPDAFRTDAAGRVTDPRHPTVASAALFMSLQTPALCSALHSLLSVN